MDRPKKNKDFYAFRAVIWLMGWIAPPLAILIRFGVGWDFFVNIILTILGYFPGHIHNFYCQTIRYNTNKKRAPRWAVKYGLVNVDDPRGGKHKWARRYDERLPDSAHEAYLADDGTGETTGGVGGRVSEWDGRGPEPERMKRRTGLSPWNNEVTPDEVEDFDPLQQEVFYGSTSQTAAHGYTEAPRRRKGLKGLLPKHKSRYKVSDVVGVSSERRGSSTTAYPPDRRGSATGHPSEYASSPNEFQDDFEAEINGFPSRRPSVPPKSQPARKGSLLTSQLTAQRTGFHDDFEAEINGGRPTDLYQPDRIDRSVEKSDPFHAENARFKSKKETVTEDDLFNHTF